VVIAAEVRLSREVVGWSIGCGHVNGTRESGRDEEMDLLPKHKG
jgi:hypothetical protein